MKLSLLSWFLETFGTQKGKQSLGPKGPFLDSLFGTTQKASNGSLSFVIVPKKLLIQDLFPLLNAFLYEEPSPRKP
mgnify:CR=1 FL=1